ncbi:MAG: cellulase family glycosylhydrolase [Proteobacteria bacterium]|nr:cellulase family glycosylhydrolase [Pseudomonadota bacterium]
MSVNACDAGESPDLSADLPSFKRCAALPISPEDMIQVEGGQFVADGKVILPHGINSYPLLQHVGWDQLDELNDIFNQAIEIDRIVIRTNAFMDIGDNPARIRDDDGTIREEGLVALDRLLALSQNRGIRLLLVLTNNWEDFGGAKAVVDAVAPEEDLPKDAFWSDPRAVNAQREYIRTLIERTNTITGEEYAKDPTVFAWELANEARCEDSEWCTDNTLVEWARKMADAAREAGAQQPIAWGGAGYLGDHGEDLDAIAMDAAVDILTLHLYLHHDNPHLFGLSDRQRIDQAIGIGARLIRDRSELAKFHNMPLLVEEFGWPAPKSANRDAERAEIYRGWLAMAHDEGVATVPWMIGEQGREDYDELLIRPEHKYTIDAISCIVLPHE